MDSECFSYAEGEGLLSLWRRHGTLGQDGGGRLTDKRMGGDKEMEAENKQILKGYYVEEGWMRLRRVMGELSESSDVCIQSLAMHQGYWIMPGSGGSKLMNI